MNTSELACLVIADFTIDILAGYLNNDEELPRVNAVCTPFGQVFQVLADESHPCWRQHRDFAVIWTRPEGVIESFKRLISYELVPAERIIADVDEYCEALLKLQHRVQFAFVPTWVFSSYHRGYGMLDMKRDIGIANAVMKMNLRLSENLEKASNIYVLNAQKWIETVGNKAFNPQLWYMAKVVFGNEVFKEATKDMRAALRGIAGLSRKLILLDLDDTLWGGIVGEDGWKNLRLGGHDPVGEAFVEFQQALKSLTNRGVLLGIVSKNEENIALEAIENNPEMILTLKDFAGWKINWCDKACNIVDLVSELNLGLRSVVFIDNDPVERARVREELPEVCVPDWPERTTLYKSALLALPYFDSPSINMEDRDRTKMYVSDRERQYSRKAIGSLENWLKTLETKVAVEELNDTNLSRVIQLFNKTNQMNLTTRRMTDGELKQWAMSGHRKFWVIRVRDKFGDSGLTGLVSIEMIDETARIVDFVLSCRVMGRNIERTILYIVVGYAQSIQLKEVRVHYIPTAANKPCFEFWQNSGFSSDKEKNTFRWDVRQAYPAPEGIEIEMRGTGGRGFGRCTVQETIGESALVVQKVGASPRSKMENLL